MPRFAVPLGDRHHETKVGLDQEVLGLQPAGDQAPLLSQCLARHAVGSVALLELGDARAGGEALLDPTSEHDLELAREQRHLPYLPEVRAHRIDRRACISREVNRRRRRRTIGHRLGDTLAAGRLARTQTTV